MNNRITLPKYTKGKNSTAHPFPFQIAMQVQKFMQGSLFYFVLMDEASGLYFRQQDSYQKIRAQFATYGYSDTTWETCWKCFEEYLTTFPNQILHMSLLSMKSHWDWYISQLGYFVLFANGYPDKGKELERIGFKPIIEQFTILENATGLKFDLLPNTIESLSELALVRNLGIHNQWEVDGLYLKWSKNTQWKKGEIRVFSKEELELWHQSLIEAIHKTSTLVAKKYRNEPEYHG